MVLVDTSIWIDHFRNRVTLLEDLLNSGEVATHPFIVGELACGNMKNRSEILKLLSALPTLMTVTHEEVLHFVKAQALHGKEIGWVDVHLLASSLLNGVPLWSRDKRLNALAKALGIAEEAVTGQ